MLLAESVAEVGLQSMVFDNGTDALEAALHARLAIVLLDVDMPGSTATTSADDCARSRASRTCPSSW